MTNSRPSSRRGFLGWFLGTSVGGLLAATVYPVLRYISPPRIPEATTRQVKAGTLEELRQTGWKIFRFGSDPGILVQVAPGDIRAFSATCTHLDCTVQYRAGDHRIWCACHNGFYDLDGINVAGPPPRPLTRFAVHVDAASGDIVVEKEA